VTEAIRELGAALREAGYTADAVRRLLALESPFGFSPRELPLYLRLAGGGSPLEALVRLFLLGASVPRDALPLLPLVPGVLATDGDEVRALVDLAPADEDVLLACDRGEPNEPDQVLGFSLPTRTLGRLPTREPIGSALDLGCGGGYQAILAARHAQRVVATDVNPRALAFTRFNALLNGVENVETREGDLLAPVAGERFDLIVSNPPHVVSPDTDFVFRDSGLEGDSLAEGLVRELPRHLEEGGFAHVVLSWAHGPDERASVPVERWLEGTGCDALVLHHASYDPLAYAAGWNRPLRFDPAAYAAALDRWRDYYRRLGIEALAEGIVVIRRRGGSGSRVRTISPTPEEIGLAGAHLARLLAAFDVLDGDILARPLALAPGHRFEQVGPIDGSAPPRTVLRLEEGLRLEVEVDEALLRLLAELAEPRPLREAIAAVAAQAEDASPEQVGAALLPQVTRLVELGFLAA
jgi:methylase of polypeptide subunit release factors